ncbi:MAG: undecaprenyl-diphosphatase [Bacillota bacterium]|nr:undecaprenyl-diphosphatase [Bacillota bacterium]MDP4169294.1 undecaprenyl-diphosphatase [Bacillota bacterium]
MLAHLDFLFFQSINHLAITERFLNPLMIFFAEKGEYLFFASMLFYWYYRKSENRSMVIEALFSACLALGINALIGMFFYRDRPFVHHHVNWLIPHVKNASFPSDHAAGAFVIATAIWLWRKRDGWILLVLAAAISISRIWTGVHYPSDVTAGMLIGVGSACTVHLLSSRSKRVGKMIRFLIGLYESIEYSIFRRGTLSRRK